MRTSVHRLPPGDPSYGHCFTNMPEFNDSQALRIATDSAVIFCRKSWDFVERFTSQTGVALDPWQCEALGARNGEAVELTDVGLNQLPEADFVELRITRWSGPAADHSTGLSEYLRSKMYLLYPGLRFSYRPLGGNSSGEYRVAQVTSRGRNVDVAKIGKVLRHHAPRPHNVPEWPRTYDDIGGLDKAIDLLRREIELPLRRTEELRQIGVTAPAGVLLFGPPGTGKTLLARVVASHSSVHLRVLSGSNLASRPPEEAEKELRGAFDRDGEGNEPPLVIIDDIDFLAPRRTATGVAAPLLGLLQDLLDAPGRPVILATTSRRDQIDPAILRLGRIGRHIPVPAPTESERRAILDIQTRQMTLEATAAERETLLTRLSRRTAGFVGADLDALCYEAGCLALRRAYPVDVLRAESPEPQAPLQITEADWFEALPLVTPSAIGGDVTEIPPTTFAQVAGLGQTVETLREMLVQPMLQPDVFREAKVGMERGILLYGPPGTGKTLLARAIANECECRFLSVRGPELLTKWFGESEQAVRDLFDRARTVAPCVVFFDEIEAIAPRRTGGSSDGSGAANRVVAQLLTEIDGLLDLGQVSIIGATNRPENVDRAILRPGRLGIHIEVPLPDDQGLKELFELYLPELKEESESWAQMTTHRSGADIAMIANQARRNALRRANFKSVPDLTPEDVTQAIAVPHRIPRLDLD